MIDYVCYVEDFLERVKRNYYQNKKIIFAFGDSWTNNTYIEDINYAPPGSLYPSRCWTYRLAEKMGYDCVVNISTAGGSNDDIFKYCLDAMCLYDEYTFNLCRIYELKATEIKVVIGWSTQIRNFDVLNNIFRPYNCASLPFVYNPTDTETKEVRSLHEIYVRNLHSEYLCFKTQLQTIALQHYFKKHGIESFYFMAFTPLLENDIVNTKWDLREEIDETRFYQLYSLGHMDNTIKKICNSDSRNKHIVESSMLYMKHFKDYYKKYLPKMDSGYLDKIDSLDKQYFRPDGHPNENGLEIISEEVYKLIKEFETSEKP